MNNIASKTTDSQLEKIHRKYNEYLQKYYSQVHMVCHNFAGSDDDDPRTRQNVYDILNFLMKQGTLSELSHFEHEQANACVRDISRALIGYMNNDVALDSNHIIIIKRGYSFSVELLTRGALKVLNKYYSIQRSELVFADEKFSIVGCNTINHEFDFKVRSAEISIGSIVASYIILKPKDKISYDNIIDIMWGFDIQQTYKDVKKRSRSSVWDSYPSQMIFKTHIKRITKRLLINTDEDIDNNASESSILVDNNDNIDTLLKTDDIEKKLEGKESLFNEDKEVKDQ